MRLNKVNTLPQSTVSDSLYFVKESQNTFSIKLTDEQNNLYNLATQSPKANREVIFLNDLLPPEVQEDLKLPFSEQKLDSHSLAIQTAYDKVFKPNLRIKLAGNIKLSKLVDYQPDEKLGFSKNFYGIASDKVGPVRINTYGAQPCLCFYMNDTTLDLTGAEFKVDKMFQDAIHVPSYSGNNEIIGGYCFTKAIDDIAPDETVVKKNWRGGLTGSIGKAPFKAWLPPIDGMSGFANKGYSDAGFDSTGTHVNQDGKSLYLELSGYRNNSIDTSNLTAGGYRDSDNVSQFPQCDGTTSPTWHGSCTWHGGWIGNTGSGLVIFQHPNVPDTELETSNLKVTGFKGRGFDGYAIELGLTGRADGTAIPRWGEESNKWRASNVVLINTRACDNYTGGIQHNRSENTWEIHSHVERMGHPDWSVDHYKPANGPTSNNQVDPGYGTSSRRNTPVRRRFVIGGVYIDCARKGLDSHHGQDVYVEKCYFKAGLWGGQIAIEENQVDRVGDGELFQLHHHRFTIRDCVFISSYHPLEFNNGAFTWRTNKSKDKSPQQYWGLSNHCVVENCVLAGPYGIIDLYSRGSTYWDNITILFANPYGLAKNANTSMYSGIWCGSINVPRQGKQLDLNFNNINIHNTPEGNFAIGIKLHDTKIANFSNIKIHTAPYSTDIINADLLAFKGKSVVRSGRKTTPLVASATPEYANLTSVYEIFSNETDDTVTPITLVGSSQQVNAEGKVEPKAAISATEKEPEAVVERQAVETNTEKLHKITFDFSKSTVDSVLDTSDKVPMKWVVKVAPDDKSSLLHNSTEDGIKFIQTRLKNASSAAGAYLEVKGINADSSSKTTVVMPIRIKELGVRAASWLLCASNESPEVIILKQDATHFKIQKPRPNLKINGKIATKDDVFSTNEWLIVEFVDTFNCPDLVLAARHDGNPCLTADIGEGLTIYPNSTPPQEEYQELITSLFNKYQINKETEQ